MKILLLIILLSFPLIVKSAPLEFKETDLQRVEERYDDTLEVETRSLYRCGEVVRLVNNPEQLAIIWDYRWTGHIWMYKVRRAHYQK